MLPELEGIRRTLEEGAELTKRLQPYHEEYAERLKAVPRVRNLWRVLGEEEFREFRERAEEALTREAVRTAIRYADRHRFGITNWGAKPESEYEPPREWRPFIANLAFLDDLRHPLGQLQHLLFDRVFERINGLYVFPAMGHDSRFLDKHAFVSVSPSPEPPAVRAGVRVHHVNKRAQDFTLSDLREAHEKLGVPRAEPRVLVLKGLQSILSPGGLKRFLSLVEPEHVVAFGSAASGVTGKMMGLPTLTPEMHRLLLGQGYRDVTGDFFVHEERVELAKIHQLLLDHFAWQGGHFPASQVRVYRRMDE